MAYHIYLVDDDRFLLDLYAMKFKNAGHEVLAFSDGESLITALKKDGAVAPDAILIDIIMPGMTGFETIEAVRKGNLAKSSKIIFLTNQGQDADIERAKQLSADGYITKASAIPSEVFAETMRIIGATTVPNT
ncbi:MAG: response regulator [Candidatus Paceibacterota bacterium]|jgi:CheY-like chemotaxis protein